MDGVCSGLCPVVGFGVVHVGPAGFATRGHVVFALIATT